MLIVVLAAWSPVCKGRQEKQGKPEKVQTRRKTLLVMLYRKKGKSPRPYDSALQESRCRRSNTCVDLDHLHTQAARAHLSGQHGGKRSQTARPSSPASEWSKVWQSDSLVRYLCMHAGNMKPISISLYIISFSICRRMMLTIYLLLRHPAFILLRVTVVYSSQLLCNYLVYIGWF